jgi:hypothetical protein
MYGLYDGVRQTATGGMAGKLRRTQIMNYTLKSGMIHPLACLKRVLKSLRLKFSGARLSNSLGTIAVVYSSLYALLSLQREEDDEVKSMVTGALTGALYKSTSGGRKCALAAAFGLAISTMWSFVLRKDERVRNYV